MSTSAPFDRWIVCIAMLFGAQLAGPPALAFGDEEQLDDAPIEAPAPGLERVGESVFGARGPQALADFRGRIDRILRLKLKSTERLWRLDGSQMQKLELAGRGDVRRLFAEIEEHRRDLNAARQPVNSVYDDNPLNRRTSAVRSKLRSGPFEDDSLFGKSLKAMLTPAQAVEYDQRRARAANSPQPISPASVADLLRTGSLKKYVYRIAMNGDGSQMALVEHHKIVEIRAFPEDRLIEELGDGRDPVDFDFGPTDDLVAFGTTSKLVTIVNTAGGEETRLETDSAHPSVAFSPDGQMLATGGYGKKAQLWSVSTGERIREFVGDGTDGGLTIVFSPDGTLLAVGNRNSTTHLFEVATGRLLHTFPNRSSHGLKFDPSGKMLAVTYVDGSLILWDVATGKPRRQVAALANELYTVDWSPDGRVLATGGYNAPVTLWNAEDLSILNEIEAPEWVFSIRFSPDGRRLVFAGSPRIRTDEKLVEIWAVP